MADAYANMVLAQGRLATAQSRRAEEARINKKATRNAYIGLAGKGVTSGLKVRKSFLNDEMLGQKTLDGQQMFTKKTGGTFGEALKRHLLPQKSDYDLTSAGANELFPTAEKTEVPTLNMKPSYRNPAKLNETSIRGSRTPDVKPIIKSLDPGMSKFDSAKVPDVMEDIIIEADKISDSKIRPSHLGNKQLEKFNLEKPGDIEPLNIRNRTREQQDFFLSGATDEAQMQRLQETKTGFGASLRKSFTKMTNPNLSLDPRKARTAIRSAEAMKGIDKITKPNIEKINIPKPNRSITASFTDTGRAMGIIPKGIDAKYSDSVSGIGNYLDVATERGKNLEGIVGKKLSSLAPNIGPASSALSIGSDLLGAATNKGKTNTETYNKLGSAAFTTGTLAADAILPGSGVAMRWGKRGLDFLRDR
jgi:hypothetical protein